MVKHIRSTTFREGTPMRSDSVASQTGSLDASAITDASSGNTYDVDALSGGGGIWTEDGNSPQTNTGGSSYTYTLASASDIVLVQVQLRDTSGAANQIDLRANGDTGTNYNYVQSDGAKATGGTSVVDINTLGSNAGRTDWFIVDGRWNNAWTGGTPAPDGVATHAVGWHNGVIASPLTQLSIIGGGTFDMTVSVFGRDIGPAGEP